MEGGGELPHIGPCPRPFSLSRSQPARPRLAQAECLWAAHALQVRPIEQAPGGQLLLLRVHSYLRLVSSFAALVGVSEADSCGYALLTGPLPGGI